MTQQHFVTTNQLRGAKLAFARLRGVNLRYESLVETELDGANLVYADFSRRI